MVDKHVFNELNERISEALRNSPAQDLEKNLKAMLAAWFARLDLVLREDFEVQKKLLEMANGPTSWHLLTISFDPEFDTPEILKAYADRYKADPKHWSFLTGDIGEIATISEQFGQLFWKDEGALNHNLRTVVIDASGKVQKVFQGNNWTTEEMVAEMVKAADVKTLKR